MAVYKQLSIITHSDTPIPFLPSRATQFRVFSLRNVLQLLCILLSSNLSAANSGSEEANLSKPLADDLQLPTISLLQKSETVQFKDLSGSFSLKHFPIVRDSETVTVNGENLTKNQDYQINYHAGTVALLNDYPPDVIVNITYQALPYEIKKRYKRNLFRQKQPLAEQLPAESEIGLEPDYARQPSTETAQPPLQVTGTQTFGVSVGSGRALSQNQELRISVDGKVSENVSVIALLSDQDLPIQPEGTTEDIQDIDQKLIRITSPNVTATLGDFEGSLGNSEFIFFPRALEGVQVEGNFKWGSFHIIPSSIPKGESASKTIRAEEGRSEYRIDADGEFVVVKAGTEIVWLNGERMRRGENHDYVIRDYGDPIIEFTSKHLITSNDSIRIDFEFIPEDLAYQRNLQGMSGLFNLLPDGRAAVGLAYTVESDLNDPENAFIILNEQDIEDLKKNELGADGNLLAAPQRHTVWGIEGRLHPTDWTSVEGQMAFSALDENTFSNRDAKVLSRAWKVLANSSSNKLQLNLDVRSLDAEFVPVGASSTNRTRFRYEEQYSEERFDDLYLLSTSGGEQSPDERSLDFDLQFRPFGWLKLDSGIGRTEERFKIQSTIDGLREVGVFTPLQPGELNGNMSDDITIRNNFNGGFDFKPQGGLVKRPILPRVRSDYRSSTSKVRGQDQFRKDRRMWNISQRIRPFNLNASIEQLESIDLDATDAQNLNRKRNISTGRVNLADFQWASINTEYSLEEAFDKEPLIVVDEETLAFSDWKQMTSAKTWTIGFFSRPRKWTNFAANLSRRLFESQRAEGADSTTQLADINLRLTPFNRALDGEMVYELDKTLATERREIYTNIHPLTGREIPPGEGHYVKIDELHYREDFEEGNYIRFIQNIDDKPVSAIDVKFRVRVQPRRMFARRRRSRGTGSSILDTFRNASGETLSKQPAAPQIGSGSPINPILTDTLSTPPPTMRDRVEWLANAIRGEFQVRIAEEQEISDPSSLLLLRNLQNEETIFGRRVQRFQLDFSPSPVFNLDVGFNTNQLLNKRINNRERRRRGRDWDIHMTLNPTAKFSLRTRWEVRRDRDEFTQLNLEGKAAEQISDLMQYERLNSMELRFELSRAVRFGVIGSHEITSDLEHLDDEPEAQTQTISVENQLVYSFIRKGRIDFKYRIGHGTSEGGVPFARYNFYEGISHEVRASASYKVHKVTDLLLRFNYRLLSTKQRKPEHRMNMEVVAEL